MRGGLTAAQNRLVCVGPAPVAGPTKAAGRVCANLSGALPKSAEALKLHVSEQLQVRPVLRCLSAASKFKACQKWCLCVLWAQQLGCARAAGRGGRTRTSTPVVCTQYACCAAKLEAPRRLFHLKACRALVASHFVPFFLSHFGCVSLVWGLCLRLLVQHITQIGIYNCERPPSQVCCWPTETSYSPQSQLCSNHRAAASQE